MKILSKIILLCIFLFAFNFKGHSQDVYEATSLYLLKHEVVGKNFLFLDQKIGEDRKIIASNVVFEQVQKLTIEGVPYVIIKPVKILKKKKSKEEEIIIPKVELYTYFIVPSGLLEDNLYTYTPRQWKMQVGISTIPVKLYFPHENSPLDFSHNSISLGPTLGISQQLNESRTNLWINYLIAMNFTMITPTKDDFDTDEFGGNSLSALSPALGTVINYNNAEIGLFLGKDFLPGDASFHWKHNGETWFSLSIGVSFSSFNTKE